jgi:uncharacterized protein
MLDGYHRAVIELLVLAALFVVAATLYSSVGHAGATAYLAAMALVGIAPEAMRPTALVLNVLVASLVTVRFSRAGWLSPRALLPFIAGSMPAALIGGLIDPPELLYRVLIAAVLTVAAARLATSGPLTGVDHPPSVPLPLALAAGAGIGLLAGLSGSGGGIFLTPLLVLSGWSGPRHAAGMSAGFILFTSLAGLVGVTMAGTGRLLEPMPLWIGCVLAGAVVGAELGSRRLPGAILRRLLAVVLLVAAAKFLIVG